MRWRALIEPPELTDRVVELLLGTLFSIDLDWLERHPETPRLYASGVRYAREEYERWRAIPIVLEDGEGDCECLACWRSAELVATGQDKRARPIWRKKPRRNAPDRWLYHIVVRRGDGSIEDPSKRLGMKG